MDVAWWSRSGRADGTYELERDTTMRLDGARGGLALRLERGCVLVTLEGDPEDHVLHPGEELRLRGRGLAVAWALSPSTLAISRADDAPAARGARSRPAWTGA
jgi:hypothetical protein